MGVMTRFTLSNIIGKSLCTNVLSCCLKSRAGFLASPCLLCLCSMCNSVTVFVSLQRSAGAHRANNTTKIVPTKKKWPWLRRRTWHERVSMHGDIGDMQTGEW